MTTALVALVFLYDCVYVRIATNPLIRIPTGFVVVTPEFLELLVVHLMQILFYFAAIFLYDECVRLTIL